VVTLGAGVGTVLAVASIWRLRRDARVIEAAEAAEGVDLTTVVKRHVPADHQTNIARDEIALAKQVILARRPRLKHIAVVFGIALVGGVPATVFSAHRYLETTAAARLAPKPPLNLAVLKDIRGVGGAGATQSPLALFQPVAVAVHRYGRNAKLVFNARLQVDAHSTGLYRHPKHRRSLRKPRKLSNI
jgi:hypothetical protein